MSKIYKVCVVYIFLKINEFELGVVVCIIFSLNLSNISIWRIKVGRF